MHVEAVEDMTTISEFGGLVCKNDAFVLLPVFCPADVKSFVKVSYGSDVKNGHVVVVRTQRKLENLRGRNAILDLHRSLIHDEHRARRYHEEDWHEL